MSTENRKNNVEFLHSEHESEELAKMLVGLMRPRLGILKDTPLRVSTRIIMPNMEGTGAVDAAAAVVVLLLSPGLEYALGGEKGVGSFMDELEGAGAPVLPVVLEPLTSNSRGHWSYAGRAVFRGPAALSCDSFAEAAESRHSVGLFANGLAQAIGHRLSGQGGYR